MLKRGNASLIPGIEVLAIVGVVHFSDYPRPGQPRSGGCAAWYCPGDEAGRGLGGRYGDLRQDTDRTLRDVNDGCPSGNVSTRLAASSMPCGSSAIPATG